MTMAFTRLRLAAIAGAFALAATGAQAETVLHRGNGAEPETLDHHKSTGVTEANIIYDLQEGLLVFSPNGEPAPGAAESWDISDDGKVYTFHLRADAKWSNGDDVTAEDFVYSLRRAVDPATASDYAPILGPILNAEDIIAGKMPTDQLGAEAVDAKTLKVTLKASTPYFLGLMVHHISWPVHKATVEKFGADWTKPGNMVSDGPYMLAEWVPQSKIVLKKNPYFHDAANVKIDTVIYYPTEDIGEEFKRFRAGELDMTYSVPTDQVKWAEKNMPNEYRNSPYFGTYYYVINLTREPLASNVNLRKALALAIDRDLLVNKITQGGEQPAYEWVPPGVPGYEQQPVDFASMTQKERNELAKKLYAEAGYSADNPLKVQVLHNTSERHRKIAIAIASMWKKTLGVDMTLTNQEWKVYLDSRDKKDFQIARAAWIGDYMDASNFLDLFVSTAGERNDAGYNNPKFDELLNAASLNPDPAARQKQLEEAERIFLTDLPIIPIYHYRNLNMISTKVKGWVPNVMGFNLTRYLSLE